MYMQIRLPLACLLTMVYCFWYFSRKRRLPTRASHAFSLMIIVTIINLLAATVTEYTVNNRDLVPEWFNYIWHVVFITTLTAWCGLMLVYMLLLIERDGGGSHHRAKVFISAFCAAVMVAQVFLPIEYIDTPNGSYSLGWKAYALYVVAVYVLIMLLYYAFRYRRQIGKQKSDVLVASSVLFIVFSLVQMVWPHILITSPGIAMIMLGLMINTEDSHLYVSNRTGLYNGLACRKIIQEKLVESDHLELGFYVFNGEEEGVIDAMRSIDKQVSHMSRELMCGMVSANSLIILPLSHFKNQAHVPDPLPVPITDDESVHYGSEVIEFKDSDDFEYIETFLHDKRRRFEAEELQLDELTHLFRRNALSNQVRGLIERGQHFSLLMIDLDDLKVINDEHGHMTGDQALQTLAEVFLSAIRASDIACRMGGDEFAILMAGKPGEANVRTVLKRITGKLEDADLLPENIGSLTISVGAREYDPSEGRITFDELYEQADMALYEVKRQGKAGLAFYLPTLDGGTVVIDCDCD